MSVDKFFRTMKQVIVEKEVIFEKLLIGEKLVTVGRLVPPWEPNGTGLPLPLVVAHRPVSQSQKYPASPMLLVLVLCS